jgi:phosphoribosylanthranilate isomerase
LLDAGQSGGGSGKRLNIDALRRLRPPKPWLLAGGMGTEHLLSSLAAFGSGSGPHGVDMNSALESAPGVKDHELIRKTLALMKTSSGRMAEYIPEKSS